MNDLPSLGGSPDLRSVAQAFPLPGRFRSGAPYGTGHINDTFAATFDRNGAPTRYILQRINDRIFRDVPALMDNIQRVTTHAAAAAAAGNASPRAPTLVSTREGRPFHRDPQGGSWRCYHFIEQARTYDLVEHPWQAYEAARAFGAFQRLLSDLPGPRLRETIPHFHHTRLRFESFRRAVAADPQGRAAGARPEIDFALSRESLADALLDLHARGEIPERIIHNDAKPGNVLLDPDTRRAVAVIDLDTVMPGLALHDFGDLVRSATNSAAEDERDLALVSMRLPIYEALLAGYLASAGSLLHAAERAHLALAGRLITFENGLRFLADHLEGDVYYKTSRPGHNLDRARNQFALVRSIEAQEPAMQAAAEGIAPVRSP